MRRVLAEVVVFFLVAINIELFSHYRLLLEGFETHGAWARQDARTGWRLTSDLRVPRYDTTPDVRTNHLGLRNEEVPSKEPGEIRLLCLGGSITFGVGLREADCWPRQLEKLLAASADVKIRVINAGQPGYSSNHAAALLEELAPIYRPDIVIGMFGFNDAKQVEPCGTLGGPTSFGDERVRNALYRLATYRYLCRLLVPYEQPPDPITDRRPAIERSQHNISEMRRFVQGWGGTFLLATESAREQFDEGFHQVPQASYHAMILGYQDLTKEGVPVVDVGKEIRATNLSDDELFQPDDPVHHTPAGSVLVAKALAERLWELGWVPKTR